MQIYCANGTSEGIPLAKPAKKAAKKPMFPDEAEAAAELPAVEGEEALADVEAEETVAAEDETFLEEEEEEGGDVGAIIGDVAEGEEEP